MEYINISSTCIQLSAPLPSAIFVTANNNNDMYISNIQWRGAILGDLHDAVCVPWGCYRGCLDCTIARGSGWVALSIIRDKHSSGARECGLADLLQATVPDGLSLPHLHLNIFYDCKLKYHRYCDVRKHSTTLLNFQSQDLMSTSNCCFCTI